MSSNHAKPYLNQEKGKVHCLLTKLTSIFIVFQCPPWGLLVSITLVGQLDNICMVGVQNQHLGFQIDSCNFFVYNIPKIRRVEMASNSMR